MSQLTSDQEQAAVLVAVGELTTEEIAAEIGVTDRTIYNWKSEDVFKARVEENKEEIRKRVFSEGIADLSNRVRRYNKRWNQIDQIFRERSQEPLDILQPGVSTGLLRKITRTVTTKAGDCIQTEWFEPESPLLKEERELAKQAAQELGQWEEKTRTSVDLSNLSDEDLEALERISSKIAPKQ